MPEPSKLELWGKFWANNLAISVAKDSTSGPPNRGGIADFPLLRTLLAICQKSWEQSFWEMMDSLALLACASLAASRTLLQQLLDCLNFTLESEDLPFRTNEKTWFLWTMASAQAAENYGDEWGLTWYFLWGTYTLIPTWTHSQNSLAVAEAPSLKISSHGTSLKWSQRPSQSAQE